jgi:hypothetical protein
LKRLFKELLIKQFRTKQTIKGKRGDNAEVALTCAFKAQDTTHNAVKLQGSNLDVGS